MSERSGESVPELLVPAEVARMFGVGAKTVARWSERGYLSEVRTVGGHRRFYAREVYRLINGEGER